MKVLMFGWEYPPHVFGGLATANYGISEGLKAQGDIEIALCLPHPFGDEEQHAARIKQAGAGSRRRPDQRFASGVRRRRIHLSLGAAAACSQRQDQGQGKEGFRTHWTISP